jgi:hypothetical protein
MTDESDELTFYQRRNPMSISQKSVTAKLLTLSVVFLILLSGCVGSPCYTPTPTVPTEVPRTPISFPTPVPVPLPEPEIEIVPDTFPSIQANVPSETEWIQWCQSMIGLPRGLVANPDVRRARGHIPEQAILIGGLSTIKATLKEAAGVAYEKIVLAEFAIGSAEISDQTVSLVSTSDLRISELEFISAFNDTAGSLYEAGPKRPIAEPNYVIREPDGIIDDPEGNPIDSGVSGDPSASPIVTGADPMSFTEQWAFEHIELANVADDRTRGQGAKIIVFDSSPLSTGPYTVWLGAPEDLYDFDGPYPPYSLCVSALIDDYTEPTGSSDLQRDSHGLFVADLAHAVAPGSAIHLVQVLKYDEESGLIRGHLFSLLNALYIYLEGDRQQREKTGTVEPLTVVNLSLGFDVSQADIDGTSELGRAIESAREALGSPRDFAVASLEALLSRYQGPGVVFVAAAGNDRGVSQLPAFYPGVIGVGALNYTDDRACFSNIGDVYAPGGGKGGSYTGRGCVFDLGICFQESECLCGVTSLTLNDPIAAGDPHSAEYACWAGTSFSAPLVSGMAALALGKGYQSGEIQELFCADPTSTPSNLCEKSVTLCNGLQYCQSP